jgi:peptide deformylase
MALLKVARMGHPVLRTKAQPVPKGEIASARVQRLIDDMFDTMADSGGIGLAGPQVHEGVRIFVAGVKDADVVDPMTESEEMPFIAIVNPEIVVVDPTPVAGWEGCLSIPDIRGKVPRAHGVRVTGFDRKGRRVENDHLDGVLFFDRMPSFETLTFMEEFRRHWARDDDE